MHGQANRVGPGQSSGHTILHQVRQGHIGGDPGSSGDRGMAVGSQNQAILAHPVPGSNKVNINHRQNQSQGGEEDGEIMLPSS